MAVKDMIQYQFTSEQNRLEASKNGRKGGIKSGEVRREKATMKKTLELLLETTNSKGQTYKELSTLGLIKGAIKGNAQNYKTILEVLGELNTSEEEKARVTIINNLPGDDDE